jgi:hypothetical protein
MSMLNENIDITESIVSVSQINNPSSDIPCFLIKGAIVNTLLDNLENKTKGYGQAYETICRKILSHANILPISKDLNPEGEETTADAEFADFIEGGQVQGLKLTIDRFADTEIGSLSNAIISAKSVMGTLDLTGDAKTKKIAKLFKLISPEASAGIIQVRAGACYVGLDSALSSHFGKIGCVMEYCVPAPGYYNIGLVHKDNREIFDGLMKNNLLPDTDYLSNVLPAILRAKGTPGQLFYDTGSKNSLSSFGVGIDNLLTIVNFALSDHLITNTTKLSRAKLTKHATSKLKTFQSYLNLDFIKDSGIQFIRYGSPSKGYRKKVKNNSTFNAAVNNLALILEQESFNSLDGFLFYLSGLIQKKLEEEIENITTSENTTNVLNDKLILFLENFKEGITQINSNLVNLIKIDGLNEITKAHGLKAAKGQTLFTGRARSALGKNALSKIEYLSIANHEAEDIDTYILNPSGVPVFRATDANPSNISNFKSQLIRGPQLRYVCNFIIEPTPLTGKVLNPEFRKTSIPLDLGGAADERSLNLLNNLLGLSLARYERGTGDPRQYEIPVKPETGETTAAANQKISEMNAARKEIMKNFNDVVPLTEQDKQNKAFVISELGAIIDFKDNKVLDAIILAIESMKTKNENVKIGNIIGFKPTIDRSNFVEETLFFVNLIEFNKLIKQYKDNNNEMINIINTLSNVLKNLPLADKNSYKNESSTVQNFNTNKAQSKELDENKLYLNILKELLKYTK